MRAVVATISTITACLMPVLAHAAEWKVVLIFVSGNLTNCYASYYDKFTVVEENNTLFLRTENKRSLFMTVPLRPDGSAEVEAQMAQIGGASQPVRVKVPAGSGRRQFEFLFVKNVCGMRVDPI